MKQKAISLKNAAIYSSIFFSSVLINSTAHAEPIVVDSQVVVVNSNNNQNNNDVINNEMSDDNGFLPKPNFEALPSNNSQQTSVINQQLADEVAQLRGIVEQLQYELDLLKSQSKERYIDLDARILDLYREQETQKTETSVASQNDQSNQPALETKAPLVASADEQSLYDKAREYMKARDYDLAVNEFDQLTQLYPQSPLAANAWYWLGEIWLVKSKISDAESAFANVLKNFPASTKRADAMYKLAGVYLQTNRKPQAKQLYQKIIEVFPNANATRLAKRKLESL
jgi:tol-pal system protein YbgF